MATVTRQDGTKITINDAITKTSFTSITAGTKMTQAYIDSLATAISKLEDYAAKVDNCGYTNCCESCQDSCTCQSSKNQGCQNTCTNCTNQGNQGCQNACTDQGCQNSCTNQSCQSAKQQACQSNTNQSCQS